jgi:Domain of unknown function (DUF5666)
VLAGAPCGWLVCAQEPVIPTLRGNITGVQPPDGFDVAGYQVITTQETEFYVLHGPKRGPDALRREIAVGTYVQVIGDMDRHDRTVTAQQVKVGSEDRSISGSGVIERMIDPGPNPVFRRMDKSFAWSRTPTCDSGVGCQRSAKSPPGHVGALQRPAPRLRRTHRHAPRICPAKATRIQAQSGIRGAGHHVSARQHRRF